MAKKSLWIGLIIGIAGLALGCLAGFAIGQSSMAAYKKAVTYWPMDLQAPGMHSHNKMNVPAGVKPPTIRIEVLPDMMKAHNYTLRLVTENFRFAPEAVSMKAVQGEGHAHLYIDDVLISRIYGEWQHIPRSSRVSTKSTSPSTTTTTTSTRSAARPLGPAPR
jgi:hypothetical protein